MQREKERKMKMGVDGNGEEFKDEAWLLLGIGIWIERLSFPEGVREI